MLKLKSEMSDDLLPCPFCGGPAEIVQNIVYATGLPDPNGWFARCGPCDLTPDFAWDKPSAEEAAKAWNTREDSAEVARLRSALEQIANEFSNPVYTDMNVPLGAWRRLREIARQALSEKGPDR